MYPCVGIGIDLAKNEINFSVVLGFEGEVFYFLSKMEKLFLQICNLFNAHKKKDLSFSDSIG